MSRLAYPLALALLAVAPPVARAQPGSGVEGAFPLRIEVGESVSICATGAVICPVGTIVCDDPALVSIGGDDRGALLKGTKPGTTLCSAGSASGAGMRRVFRVTVEPKPEPAR